MKLLRWAGLVSAVCLAMLWATYYLTVEPSASLNVRWREGVTVAQRADRERRYLLEYRGEAGNGWTRYDLLDTSTSNISAIVRDPAIADTTDIDREAMSVPFDTDYGKGWMWAAHRTPGLRRADVRWGLIAGLAGVALAALVASRRHGGD